MISDGQYTEKIQKFKDVIWASSIFVVGSFVAGVGARGGGGGCCWGRVPGIVT